MAEATTNSLLWQGAQMFGFIFVIIMDVTRGGPSGSPPRNMTNALIFQAVVGGLIVLLSFCYTGTMARSEAAAFEARALERLNEISEKDKEITRLSTSSYPLSSVLGVTLSDNTPTSNEDPENIRVSSDARRSGSVSYTIRY